MSQHTLLTGKKLFRNQDIGDGFRTFVYSPDVTGKGGALTKPSTAHRTAVGFLTIVYSPDVPGKGDALPKPSTAHRTDVGLLALVDTPVV